MAARDEHGKRTGYVGGGILMPPGVRSAKVRFKPILPKKFKPNGFYDLMGDALRKTQEELEESFALTTWSWNHQPRIAIQKRMSTIKSGGRAFVRVYTRDRIYVMLEFGTRAHTITRRTAPALRYQMDFTPKTSVRWLGSRPGGKFGNWTNRISVQHPGFESRLFTVTMRLQQQPRLVRRAQWAMVEGAKRSGHAI